MAKDKKFDKGNPEFSGFVDLELAASLERQPSGEIVTKVFQPRPPRVRRRVQKVFTKPSRTDQSFREEADINSIVKRHVKMTGERFPERGMPAVLDPRFYGDFSQVGSFQDAIFAVDSARESFMTLPSNVRAFFENDPAKLLSFMADSRNFDKAVELGLVKPKAQPSPAPAPAPAPGVPPEKTPPKADG